jgi:hypothetical protein
MSECFFFFEIVMIYVIYIIYDLVRPGFDLNKIGLTSITWDLRANSKSSESGSLKRAIVFDC